MFYGPPGTGKTFVARKLAGHLARGGGVVEKVHFHPSYAYEDFNEGSRGRAGAPGAEGGRARRQRRSRDRGR
ncbi:AAA family ATPase [Kineococcus endophyticus]|uniref:AAA family ATPase n=1 Tax=Kineococcus endophyticus TaxID=1181883 RepID=A0ABV3PDV1_9ACTN